MNELELLREAAKETPLPAAADLGAARARLVAAIAANPASSLPARQARPPAPAPAPVPAPVLGAVKLMYGGAAGTVVQLIIALVYVGDVKAYHLTALGRHLTTAQLSHLRPLIVTLVIVAGLALIALWLWMARAVSRGGNWARILSTVLFGLATLELIGIQGDAQLFWALLTWLTGLAAIWQLWRPASSAFFRQVPRDGRRGSRAGR
jgi:hypothetical protein